MNSEERKYLVDLLMIEKSLVVESTKVEEIKEEVVVLFGFDCEVKDLEDENKKLIILLDN
jgi:hypothetical protein